MSLRRSPSGEPMGFIDQLFDKNVDINIVGLDTNTLTRKLTQYQIVTGAIGVNDSDLNLPVSPQDGDEIYIVSAFTSGGGNLRVLGNGFDVGSTGITVRNRTSGQSCMLKFVASLGLWAVLA